MWRIWHGVFNTLCLPLWRFRRVRQVWIWSTGSPWAEAWALSEDGA